MVIGSFPVGAAMAVGIMVSPMYTMEIAPPHLRGFAGPGTVVGISLGQLCILIHDYKPNHNHQIFGSYVNKPLIVRGFGTELDSWIRRIVAMV